MILIAVFFSGVGVASFVWMYSLLVEARKRIVKLEEANQKHLPFHTASEIENATAELLMLESQKSLELEYVTSVLAHLRKAREDRRGKKADLEP